LYPCLSSASVNTQDEKHFPIFRKSCAEPPNARAHKSGSFEMIVLQTRTQPV
jgi:hypothetical protein